ADIKKTFDRLGVPQNERKFFAGVGAQYDSEVIYHSVQEHLEKQGVIFLDTDTALVKHPELFRRYFGTVVPPGDNKFAALNSACWSGGSFIYVPPGVKVDMPLQAYFRINQKNMGQFERTLIIADEGSFVHYIEGCTAPIYSTDSLHAAVVEIIARPGAHVRYTTVQNWSSNVYNLVTKRARAEENAFVEWIDGNLGSKLTMKYPAVFLAGRGAKANILSVAMAGKGQHQDAGAKVVHMAPDTTSSIVSKSVSFSGGRTTYRGLAQVVKGAVNARITVRCDALMLGSHSRSDTYPTIKVAERDVRTEHEAHVSKISERELFYLRSRGMSETEAASLVVAGFFDPFAHLLPPDYAIELERLIQMEMEGAVG
ncbi:MAG: Fe-S cluster assembly protein SufB, partial [Patescibacteria group bacterium]